MKKIIIAALIGVASIASTNYANAQVNVNVNIGSQPLWGPTGYDHVDYYYLPEVDSYYYVPGNQYVYKVNNTWVKRSTLPAQYRNVDLYRTYKVVMNGDKPYLKHPDHRVKYKSYKSSYNKQTPIRDSRDNKYKEAKSHPGKGNTNHTKVEKGKNGKDHRSENNGNNGKGRGGR